MPDFIFLGGRGNIKHANWQRWRVEACYAYNCLLQVLPLLVMSAVPVVDVAAALDVNAIEVSS